MITTRTTAPTSDPSPGEELYRSRIGRNVFEQLDKAPGWVGIGQLYAQTRADSLETMVLIWAWREEGFVEVETERVRITPRGRFELSRHTLPHHCD